jgi:hypothetical protein
MTDQPKPLSEVMHDAYCTAETVSTGNAAKIAELLRDLAFYADEISSDYGSMGSYDEANIASMRASAARAMAKQLDDGNA